MSSGGWAQYRGSLGGGGAGNQGDMHRRMRNRTLTGLESMRGMGGMDHLRPASAQGRPITPSFSNEKDPGQTFIDFNPAGEVDMIIFLKCKIAQSLKHYIAVFQEFEIRKL